VLLVVVDIRLLGSGAASRGEPGAVRLAQPVRADPHRTRETPGAGGTSRVLGQLGGGHRHVSLRQERYALTFSPLSRVSRWFSPAFARTSTTTRSEEDWIRLCPARPSSPGRPGGSVYAE
jgi:hypothetical protein